MKFGIVKLDILKAEKDSNFATKPYTSYCSGQNRAFNFVESITTPADELLDFVQEMSERLNSIGDYAGADRACKLLKKLNNGDETATAQAQHQQRQLTNKETTQASIH